MARDDARPAGDDTVMEDNEDIRDSAELEDEEFDDVDEAEEEEDDGNAEDDAM
jgi:hypothetical protein